MTTIDHAAEARRALRAADEVPADEVAVDPWLLAAQVHATLALVDQQRISNLIALSRVPVGMLTDEHKADLASFFNSPRRNAEGDA